MVFRVTRNCTILRTVCSWILSALCEYLVGFRQPGLSDVGCLGDNSWSLHQLEMPAEKMSTEGLPWSPSTYDIISLNKALTAQAILSHHLCPQWRGGYCSVRQTDSNYLLFSDIKYFGFAEKCCSANLSVYWKSKVLLPLGLIQQRYNHCFSSVFLNTVSLIYLK